MNAQRKSLLKFLRVIMRNILPLEKALYLTKIDRNVEGYTITRKSKVIETKTIILDFKTMRVQVSESSNMLVQHQKVYLKTTKLLGNPAVDLFASRLCHKLPKCVAWKLDPNCFATDAMQQDWSKMFDCAFPPFSLIGRVINKVLQENVETTILVTPIWQTQP